MPNDLAWIGLYRALVRGNGFSVAVLRLQPLSGAQKAGNCVTVKVPRVSRQPQQGLVGAAQQAGRG